MDIVDRSIACRNALGLIQEDIATSLKISQPSYNRFETRLLKKLPKYLKNLALILKTTPEWLAFGVGSPPSYLSIDDSISLTDENEKLINKIALIPWDFIPSIVKNLSALRGNDVEFIDFSFSREEEVFASRIPDTIVPGETQAFFKPKEILLISPKRKPVPKQHVVVFKPGWNEPLYMQYWIQGDEPKLKHTTYDSQRLEPVTDDTQICGVVVASYNIFI